MRIAVLTNAYPPDAKGGAGEIAGAYAGLLRSRGHEIRVWGPRVGFERLGKMNPVSRLFFHFRDLRADALRAEEIREWKPAALLTHNLTGCGFGTPRAIRSRFTVHGSRQTVRWVHVLHDVQLVEPSGRIVHGESFALFRSIWRFTWSALRRLAFGEPDAVASPTHWLLAFHRGYGWFRDVRAEVIPNPIPTDTRKEDARDPKQVLYVGRLDHDKGIDVLLEAWPAVAGVASRLLLIGDGARRRTLEARHDPRIVVRGPQPHDAVLAAMRASGIVVVPSLVCDNQPTVILEALAAGCRVVASRVGGIPETLGAAGWLAEPGSPSSLAERIRDALVAEEDPERAHARADLLRVHDPALVAGRLEGLLTSNA